MTFLSTDIPQITFNAMVIVPKLTAVGMDFPPKPSGSLCPLMAINGLFPE